MTATVVTPTVDEWAVASWPAPTRRQAARTRFPARLVAADWPGTCQSREQVVHRLTRAPFVPDNANSQDRRRRGLPLLLDWLQDQPGRTWQQRWLASGADTAGGDWRAVSTAWLRSRGQHAGWAQVALAEALVAAIGADLLRPSLSWLASRATGPGVLVGEVIRTRDREGFARLRARCEADPGVSAVNGKHALYRGALIVAAKGGVLGDITVGDVLELLDAEADLHVKVSAGTAVFYRMLHEMGIFTGQPPARLREVRTRGQRTPEELIDCYRLVCRPVRDLLVDYLRERQPALDYTSLKSLANHLGKLFWADLERHHPGIDSLHLRVEVADAWKQRLRTIPTTVATPTGDTTEVAVPRINYRECLTPVRAFYLDLSHWAVEDPARWGPWAVPCPVGEEEVNRRKAHRQRKSRMDARTRERLPVLPVLLRTVEQRRTNAETLLATAHATRPGDAFTAAGQTLIRSVVPHATAPRARADDPTTGKRRRDLDLEEDHAFWAWATVEVLRATGVRVEELLELSHHSLVQYRLPTTGELVPLLQIAPSKPDTARLLPID